MYSFEPSAAPNAIGRWINSVPVDGTGGFSRSFFEEHVREKFGTYSWLFEAMLEKVGFEIRSVSYSDTQCHGRYLCIKPIL